MNFKVTLQNVPLKLVCGQGFRAARTLDSGFSFEHEYQLNLNNNLPGDDDGIKGAEEKKCVQKKVTPVVYMNVVKMQSLIFAL